MTTKTLTAAMFIAALHCCVCLGHAQSDTSFTFQGELRQAGAPAAGSYSMVFTLWDAESAGNQVGPFVIFEGQSVVDGRFNVQLNFGADAFDNGDRWLEVTISGQTLSPRQPITRAPYAIQTRGIHVSDAGNIGIGTTSPQRQLDLEADESRLRLTATDPTAGATSRLQFKSSAGPSIFHPLGMLEFFDETDTLRATVSANKAGSGSADLNFNVTPGDLPQMRIGSSGVRFQHEIKPPIAYGQVGGGGGLISGSTNISSVDYLDIINGGEYFIEIDGGLLDTDIVIATIESSPGFIRAKSVNGGALVVTYGTTGIQNNREFSFVIYRP